MSRVRTECWLAMGLALSLLAGCGSGVKDRLFKVTGAVKFADGQPVTAGTIYFDSTKYNAYGEIQPDGTFALTTLHPGDGAPAGTYQVYLREPAGDAVPKIHLKHISPVGSGITQEVKPEANTVEITVERYVPPPPEEKK